MSKRKFRMIVRNRLNMDLVYLLIMPLIVFVMTLLYFNALLKSADAEFCSHLDPQTYQEMQCR
jgi:hypothetical protein